MVAYGFQARFVTAITAGDKRQTVRGPRRRHARPEDSLQLYTGLRTKRCRLIGRATCLSIDPISLDFHADAEVAILLDETPWPDRDGFARLDGFDGFEDMARFWRERHGVSVFSGFLVRWYRFTVAEIAPADFSK